MSQNKTCGDCGRHGIAAAEATWTTRLILKARVFEIAKSRYAEIDRCAKCEMHANAAWVAGRVAREAAAADGGAA